MDSDDVLCGKINQWRRTRFIMSGLRGSPGYIWDVKRLLGQGATSMVCHGRNKRTGEQVAVKVFNDAGNMRPTGVKNREFEVLRKLDHVNIVRMIASEIEQGSTNQVIVMELCTGGSVYTMLEEPKNAFGVEEEEFLLILEHVASGMKHLREHGIVHRDIKPGNIMRFIAEDGRSIYKLTDFGAARELEEEGQFMSLYGTEEYLHPDMYERAVLRGQDYKVFRATVDLWSLGVTFYHILTGQLPFRPFGGRRNRETMHKITTQKESGIISGVQHSESGPIEWSRQLPQSCRVSLGLQLLIVPFLASLLEADPRKTWQFDRFFIEAKKITSKKVIPMFSVPTWIIVKIYADVTDNLTKIQELVAQQTEIPAPNQLIIYQNQLLSEIVDPTQTVVTYPRCISPTKPIFIFAEDDIDSIPFPSPYISNFPRFSTTMSLDNDYPLAKMCVGILHAIHREISDCVLRQRLTHEGIVNYVNQLYHSLEHLRDNDYHLRRYCQETKNRKSDLSRSMEDNIHMLRLFSQEKPALSKLLHTLSRDWHSNLQILEEFDTKMDKLLSVISKSTGLYTRHHLERRDLLNAWDFKLGCEESMRCAPRLEMTIKSATVIMERFKIDKQKKVLPYNDEQIHKFEKNNLYTLTGKARNTLREHCIPKSQVIHQQVCGWLCRANVVRLECRKTEKEMEELIALQECFTVKLDKLFKDDKFIQSLERLSVESAHGMGDGARWVRNGSQEQAAKPDSLVEYLVESMDSLNFDTMQVIENIKENTNSLHRRWRKEMGLVDESVPTAWGQADVRLSVFRQWTTKATSSVSKFPSTQQGVFLEVGLNDFLSKPSSLDSLPVRTNLQDYDEPAVLNIHGQNANGLSLLHLSTFAENVETSRWFISQGVNVDCEDKLYLTPLHWAIIKGSDEMVTLLLEKNASLFVAAIGKNTAAHIAARFGRSSILKLLVQKDPGVANLRNMAERTALHLASMHGFGDCVQILLNGVAEISPVDKHGMTPLHLASACGYVEAVQLLLSTGKNNLELTCKAGFTPLLLAIQNGHKPVVDILLRSNANLDSTDGRGRGPLHLAVLHGHLDLTQYILNLDRRSVNVDAQDHNGFTSLHYAACKKDSEALKLLLCSERASVLSRNQWLQTPLHVAATSGSVMNVRLLIDHNADLEAKDECGRSPLQVAVAMGNRSIVGLFHSMPN